ncbi:unnamed protein product [Moneuplotes crassus]|uniref:Uncharacterized protein n=1 Tax=Euplotes crassus TaxID=5936 RepID=A0AAD2DAL1_EUPCR|nr:unnamed protein product [Moneuplotes crassus]
MESYSKYCDENCGEEAQYYVKEIDQYYCRRHFDLNCEPEDGIRLTSPDVVKSKIKDIENGLKIFLAFTEDKLKGSIREESELLYTKLDNSFQQLKTKVEEANANKSILMFTDLKKEASQLKTEVDNESLFNSFTTEFFWSLSKEAMNSDEAPALAKQDPSIPANEHPSHSNPIEEAKAQPLSKPKPAQNSPLQKEMVKDPDCRLFIQNMGKDQEVEFWLEKKFCRKLFGLMDQEVMEGLNKISVMDAVHAGKDEFATFMSKIPDGLIFLYFSLGASIFSISPYLPSILALKSRLKGGISFNNCTITEKEKADIGETFKDNEVQYGKPLV